MSQNSKDYELFRKKLMELGADLEESAKRIVSQTAAVGMRVSVRNTPHKTGYLQKMWQLERVKKNSSGGWTSGYSNDVEYGVYVNNGHVVRNKAGGPVLGYVKGKHMLEQGISAAKRQQMALFRQEIERVKKKGGW